MPRGTWEAAAGYVSAAPLRQGLPPEEMAGRVRAVPGVAGVEVGRDGLLLITVAEPGELLLELGEPEPLDDPWPDFPRTWDNPGFVVRYAHARAAAVLRWAAALAVPFEPFEPELLAHPRERAVLRLLAELPGRRVSRDPAWEAYLVRLALAYHDVHEQVRAVPVGDEPVAAVHTARVRLAGAVQKVLPGPERI